jgi:hypothetical protein
MDHAIPIFAAGLYATLHDEQGFKHLVLEQAPVAIEDALAPARRGDLEKIAALRTGRRRDHRRREACPALLANQECPHYSTRTEVSSEIISSMRSRSGIHGASLIMRTCEMIGVRSGKVFVGSGRRMSALTRTSCGKPCDTMP